MTKLKENPLLTGHFCKLDPHFNQNEPQEYQPEMAILNV